MNVTTISSQDCAEFQTSRTREKNVNKKRREKSCFTNGMTYYVENFKESTTKTETNTQLQADYRTQG